MNPRITALENKKRELQAEIAQTRGEIQASGQPATEDDTNRLQALSELAADYSRRIDRMQELYTPNGREKPVDGLQIGVPGQAFAASGVQSSFSMPRNATAGEAWYYKTFGPPAASNNGFESYGEFLRTIESGSPDHRLHTLAAGQLGGEGARGGFLVPEEHRVSVIGPAYEASVCMQRADVHSMGHETLTIAGWDTSSAEGGTLFGGFTASIVPEAGDMSPQEGQVRAVKLTARKAAILARSSNELVADAPALNSLMETSLGQAIGYVADYWCLNGTGAGQPLGALVADSRITVDKENAQAADTITAANISTMFSRLHPALYSQAVWMAHPSTIPMLEGLQVSAGTAGQLWPGLVRLGEGGYGIMGRPCIISEKLPPLGDEGDIVLIDWSQYALGMRSDISIQVSAHIYFTSDQTAYRAIMRFDGRPKWNGAYTDIGGNTYSWCVTLEDRD